MANSYGIYGQITGKDILQDQNIIGLFNLEKNQYVSSIAIRTDPTREVIINNSKFYIGDTGVIQFYDININSVIFPEGDLPIDDDTVITFAIDEEKEN